MATLGLLVCNIVQLVLVACLLIRNGVAAAHDEQNSSSIICFPSDLHALRSFAAGLPPDAAVVSADLYNYVFMNESWNVSERDCCSWQGVSCTTTSSSSNSSPPHPHNNVSNNVVYARVTALSLTFKGEWSVAPSAALLESLCNLSLLSTLYLSSDWPLLQGPLQIPECLGDQLPLLQVLDLNYLNLKGPIPSSFSRLLHLQDLDLSFNFALDGPLLPLLHLPSLTSLSLESCSFSGPLLPSGINTPLLQSLSLSSNHLNSTLDQFTLLSNLTGLTDLDLSANDLSGPIPPSISRLFNLQSLRLGSNSFSAALPDSLSKLSSLATLDLSSNNFAGPFPPWIGNCSSLADLDLSSNQFAGPIPDEWENLQNLSRIHLGSGNSLNGTRLPEWLFRFPKLETLELTSLGLQSEDVFCSTRVSMLNKTIGVLDLSGNNITGSDLLECIALPYFVDVRLSNNPLSISLSHIELAPAIRSLSLSNCNLTGFLNDKVFEGRFSLDLSHNHLVGKIPTKHTNLTATQDLDLSNNYFTGFDSYGSFPSLFSVRLSNNSIAGDVSTVLHTLGVNCTGTNSWSTLELSYNKLVGKIPAFLAECANYLSVLYLDHNNLTGQIPENFGKFQNNMQSIRLTHNHLKGTIPASIITTYLVLLDVSYNDLEGDLKALFSFLQSRPYLIVLSLAHNRISGSIPPFLGNFTPALLILDLSYNNLTGNIPQDLYLPSFQNVEIISDPSNIDSFKALTEKMPSLVIKGVEMSLEYVWKNFRFLDLSENHLEGVIPWELGDLSALLYLNLSHNSLSGRISEAFGKLSMLESLDLSFNKLEGPIPPSLSNLTKLGVFNVSYNEALVGSIPAGIQLENNESYRGDPLLCGYAVLQRACPVVDVTNASNYNMTINEKVASTWMDEWVSVPGLYLGIVVGFFGILWLLHGPRLVFSKPQLLGLHL